MKQGQYIYAVSHYGKTTPYIIVGVDNIEDVVFIISIQFRNWNDRMVVRVKDIKHKCFAESDAFPNNGDFAIPSIDANIANDEKHIAKYLRISNTDDYNDEDDNMKLYETKQKTFTQANFDTIKKRLEAYRCAEIPSSQQDELMNRLMALPIN